MPHLTTNNIQAHSEEGDEKKSRALTRPPNSHIPITMGRDGTRYRAEAPTFTPQHPKEPLPIPWCRVSQKEKKEKKNLRLHLESFFPISEFSAGKFNLRSSDAVLSHLFYTALTVEKEAVFFKASTPLGQLCMVQRTFVVWIHAVA